MEDKTDPCKDDNACIGQLYISFGEEGIGGRTFKAFIITCL